MLAVSVNAILFDMTAVLLTAACSALIWDYFFIPPRFTFRINQAEDVLLFVMYFVIALLHAVLTTKIRQAEKKAFEKEEQEKSIQLFQSVLNSLSHEIRTPLSTLLTGVDTLKNIGIQEDKALTKEILQDMTTAAGELNQQVEQLLRMNRIEAGMIKLQADWCDINELLHSVISKAQSPSHQINFAENESLPLFKVDAWLLGQAIENVLFNGLKHTPAGCTISITAAYEARCLVITVSDNGPGLLESDIPRLFEKFFRGEGARQTGIGLGLSIAQGFVLAHNGTLRAWNGANGGAIFEFRIPATTNFINKLHHE